MSNPEILVLYTRLHETPDRHQASAAAWHLAEQAYNHFFPNDVFRTDLINQEYERPEHRHVDFNLAHSGPHVICAMTMGGRVGIDIEPADRPMPAIPEKWIDREKDRLTGSPDNPLHYWCAKEAVLKVEGQSPLDAFPGIRLNGEEALYGNERWKLRSLEIPDAIAWLATNRDSANIRTEHHPRP